MSEPKKVMLQPNSFQTLLQRYKSSNRRMVKNLYLKLHKGRANSSRKNKSKEGSTLTCSAATIPLPCLDSDISQLLEDGPCGLDLDGEMLIVKNAPTDYNTKVNGVLSESFLSKLESSDLADSMDEGEGNASSETQKDNDSPVAETLPTVNSITGNISSAPLNVVQKNEKILPENLDEKSFNFQPRWLKDICTTPFSHLFSASKCKGRACRSMMSKCSHKRKKRSKHSTHFVFRPKIRTLASMHRQRVLNQFTRSLLAIKHHGSTNEPHHCSTTKDGKWTVTSIRPDQRNESASEKLPDIPMLSIRERPTIYYSLSEIVKYIEVLTNSFKSMLVYLHGKEIMSRIDSFEIKDQLEGYICFTHDKVTLLLNLIAVLDDHQILLMNEEELNHVWHVHDVITCLLQAYRNLKVLKPEEISDNHFTSLILLCAEVLVPRRKFPLDKWSRCMNRIITIQTKMLENKIFEEVCQCRNRFSSVTGKNQCALCDCNVLFQELCYGRTGSCKMEDFADVFDDMIHDPQLSSSGHSSGHSYLEKFSPTLHWFSSNLKSVENSKLQNIIDIHNSHAFSCHPDAGLYACSKHRSVRVCHCFEEAFQPTKECSSLNILSTPKVVCSDAIANNEVRVTEKNLKFVTTDDHDPNTMMMALPVSKPSSDKEHGQCQNNYEDSRTFVEHHSESCTASNFNEEIGEKCISGDSTGKSNRENSITSKMCEPTPEAISSLKIDRKHDIPCSLTQPSNSSKQVEMNEDEFSLRVSDSDSNIEVGGNETIRNEPEECQAGSLIKSCSKAKNNFCNMNKKEDGIQIEKVIPFLDLDSNISIDESGESVQKLAAPVLSDETYSQCGQPDSYLETDSYSVHSLSGSNCSQSSIECECVRSIPPKHTPPYEKQESNPKKLDSPEHISSQVHTEEIPVISMQDTSQNAKCNENRKGFVSKQETINEKERKVAVEQDKTVLSNKALKRMSSQTHTEGGDSEVWDKIWEQYKNIYQEPQKHSQQMTNFSKKTFTASLSTVDVIDSDSSEILLSDSEDGGDSLQVQFSNSMEEKNNACDTSSSSSYQDEIMFDVGAKKLSSLWGVGNVSVCNDPCKSINAAEKVSNKIQNVKDADIIEVQKELKRQSENSSISNLRKEQKEFSNEDSTYDKSGHLHQQSFVRAGKNKYLNSKIKPTRLSLKKVVVPNRTEVLDPKNSPEPSELFKPSDCKVGEDNSKQDHQNKTMNALDLQRESAQLSHQPKPGSVFVVDREQTYSASLEETVENCTLDLKEAGIGKQIGLSSDKRRQRISSKDQDAGFEAKQNGVCEADKPASMEIKSSLIQESEHPLKMAEQNQLSISSEEGLASASEQNKLMSEENRQENLIPQTSKMHQKPKKKVRFCEDLNNTCDTKKSNNDFCERISKCKITFSITDSSCGSLSNSQDISGKAESLKSDQDHPFNKKLSDGELLEPCKEEVKKGMSVQTSLGTALKIQSKESAKLQNRDNKLKEIKIKTKIPSVILEHSDTGDVAEKWNTESEPQKDVKKGKKKYLSDTKVCFAENVPMQKDGPQHMPKRLHEKFSSSYNNGVECSPSFSVKETSQECNQHDFCEADTDEMFKSFLIEVIRVLDRRELKCNDNATQESNRSDNSHVDVSFFSSNSDDIMRRPVNNQSIAGKKKRAHLSGGKKTKSDSSVKKRKINQPMEGHGSDSSLRVCESDSDDKFQLYVNSLQKQFGVFPG